LVSAKSIPSASISLQSTGRKSRAMTTSERSKSLAVMPMLFAEASRASHSHRPRGDADQARRITVSSGQRCAELFRSASRLGFLVRMLLTSTEWHSRKWWLIWRGSDTRSRRRLKFRLVPSDTITGGRASGFLATPTATANQGAPSMMKHPGCRDIIMDPEVLEERMGFPKGWTDLGHSATRSSRKSPKSSD
jgi:hypothetical protein